MERGISSPPARASRCIWMRPLSSSQVHRGAPRKSGSSYPGAGPVDRLEHGHVRDQAHFRPPSSELMFCALTSGRGDPASWVTLPLWPLPRDAQGHRPSTCPAESTTLVRWRRDALEERARTRSWANQRPARRVVFPSPRFLVGRTLDYRPPQRKRNKNKRRRS